MAERYLLASLHERLTRSSNPEDVAFDHLRLSQVYRKVGKQQEALEPFGQARNICTGERCGLYVELEYATPDPRCACWLRWVSATTPARTCRKRPYPPQ